MRRNSDAGGRNATGKSDQKYSQTRSRCLAVSMGGERPSRETHLPKKGDRHSLPVLRCGFCPYSSHRIADRNQLKWAATRSFPLTVKEVCNHFEQRELNKDNIWRSYSTKKSYKAYLNRWIIPHWRTIRLSEVRTIQVESWLRGLPLAKSSCARIRNLFSVLFNHPCLPSRTVRSQSDPFGPPRCKAANRAKRADAR